MVRTRATKIIEGDVRYLCSGCGEYKKREEFSIDKCAGPLQLHHPSYETEDMWEYIVPLCPSCHSKVHKQGMPCPPPIKLTDLVKQKKGGDDLRKNIRTLPNRPTTMKNISVGKSPKVNEKKSSDKDKQ